jgi:hypothetical protein
MNKTKFTLADVIGLLAILSFGFVCFLSLNFVTLGETSESIISAIVISIILGSLALGLKLLKITGRNFRQCKIIEMILVFVFCIVAIISISFFSHFFVVSEHKTEISNEITKNIEQAEKLFNEYEDYANKRIDYYKRQLETAVTRKRVNPDNYLKMGFVNGEVSDKEQIDTKVKTLTWDLYPSNYADFKSKASSWLSDAKKITKAWRPISLVGVVNNIDKNVTAWIRQLVDYTKVRQDGEDKAKDFSYEVAFGDVKSYFEQSDTPTLLAAILSVVAYLCMLLPYFVTPKHPRNPGWKVIFRVNKTQLDNEL